MLSKMTLVEALQALVIREANAEANGLETETLKRAQDELIFEMKKTHFDGSTIEAIGLAYQQMSKIMAIKLVKKISGEPLIECKRLVEGWAKTRGWKTPFEKSQL
jgi:ribosomal protein L7/L12